MKRSIPILLYHHVSPEREMTPRRFEYQLEFLAESAAKNLTVQELVDGMQGTKTLDQAGFVLTFDDGYLNNWLYAFPLLNKWKMKAMIYLVTERVDTDGFLSWDQIRAMDDSGLVTFGSHTHTHRHFKRGEAFQNIEDELRQSKDLIETHLKKPCRHLAWPWGDYENQWLPLAKSLGYDSTATTLAGANAHGTDPFRLRRINVRNPDTKWLKKRLDWNERAVTAGLFGAVYGWDRRFKVWWNKESPYPHG